MIRLLIGTVHSSEDRALVLLVQGVGYQVFVPDSHLEYLPEQDLTLHIHSHVREDSFTLYGFRTKKELNLFELLLTINGVGPKMALALLNESPANLESAIFSGNLPALTRIPGVGKKIAERIILELKGKVFPTEDGQFEQKNRSMGPNPAQEDAILALESLGYKRHHIQNILTQLDEDITEAEGLIKWFLGRV